MSRAILRRLLILTSLVTISLQIPHFGGVVVGGDFGGAALEQEMPQALIVPLRGYRFIEIVNATQHGEDAVLVLMRGGRPDLPTYYPAPVPLLTRLLLKGGLDAAFGNGGLLELDLEGRGRFGSGYASSLAVLPDGRAIVAGTYFDLDAVPPSAPDLPEDLPAFGGVALVAMGADGQVDRSFGLGGRLDLGDSTQLPNRAFVAVQTSSRLVVAWGAARQGGNPRRVKVCRLLPDGRTDPTFSDHGCAVVSGATDLDPVGLAVGPDDAIVVATQSSPEGLTLVQLTPDGSLHGSYGSGGFANVGPAGLLLSARRVSLDALAIQPNGSLVFSLTQQMSPNVQVLLVGQLTRDGTLDKGFGLGGIARVGERTRSYLLPVAGGLAFAPECGYLQVVGNVYAGGFNSFEVYSLNARGEPVTRFGDKGRVVTQLPGYDSALAGPLLQMGPRNLLAVASVFGRQERSIGLFPIQCSDPGE